MGLNMEVVVLQDYYVFVFKLTYGVIGNTTVFETAIRGSNPCGTTFTI